MAVPVTSVSSGFECSICLELLCEPMQLPCSHTFCRKCLANFCRVSRSRQCALCRASIPESFDPIVGPVHQELEQKLMRQCTMEYTQRMHDVALEAARLVRLKVSNTHEFVCFLPRPKHKWTIEVQLEVQADACLPRGSALPDIVKHVRFALPSACRVLSSGSSAVPENERDLVPPNYIEVRSAPFQVTATSPMACAIPIVIVWQDWMDQAPLRLEHDLDFNREGGCWDYGVDLHTALTGRDLTKLAQVQNLQRQQTQHNLAMELSQHRYRPGLLPLDIIERAAQEYYEREEVVQEYYGEEEENQHHILQTPVRNGVSLPAENTLRRTIQPRTQTRRKSSFSIAWDQVRRHLPRIRSSKRSSLSGNIRSQWRESTLSS